MATKFAEAFVEIGARLDNTQFGRMRQTIGSRMQSIGRSAGMMFGAAMAGAIAVTGVVATISKLTNLARDQLKEERKLEAVLKATGHAAGYSADQLKRMAADLQAVTNFGDETTISAMAVLATFRQIRGDVFREAIESAQDLSAVMGQSLQSSIVMIGKALNSPKESLTALSRAGITFSEQQKEQIKLFEALQSVASATMKNPDQIGQAGKLAETGLLPKFIEALPYRSEILSLSEDSYASLTADQRAALETSLLAKLEQYRDINESDAWIKLNPADSDAEKVFPLHLSYLP